MDIAGLLPLVLPIAAAVLGAARGIKFVSEGERALMLRFDKAVVRRGEYRVIFPGLRLMLPGVHKLARIHVRQRTINFPSQTIVLRDQTVFRVSAVLLCRVKDAPQDLYNALFETTGIDKALTDYGLTVIRTVLGSKGYKDLLGEGRAQISQELAVAMRQQADQWGVEAINFELSDCEPTDETARLIQTSVQTGFKLGALSEAAARLGCEVSQIDPTLAAVLIGTPLVATTKAPDTAV